MNPILQLENVTKSFNQVNVLKGISCEFYPEQDYVIRGASGSGKSTLLYLLGGLDQCSSGTVLWKGMSLENMNDEKISNLRNSKIGFIFQFHYLLPTMTVEENVLLPQKISQSAKGMTLEELKNLARELEVVDLFNRYPTEISGGERQRVNLLRAVSMRPEVLLCDEPTGSLDSANSEIVTSMLHKLSREFKATLITVTHSDEVASTFSNELVIKDGVIV
jgi:ABC-type lipoprotein export system ATPase subunit